MSLRSNIHHFSELIKDYDIVIFLLLVSFGWLIAWISFVVFAVLFAR